MLRAAHPEWFGALFALDDAAPPSLPFGPGISRDFGIEARSWFRLRILDKERCAGLAGSLVDRLYQVFGTDDLVVTWELDTVQAPARSYPAITLP